MNLKPKVKLTDAEISRSLRLVVLDGLLAEAMTTFTGPTFILAMAILAGASNAVLGVLVALPTFANLFQIFSIWLIKMLRNRRAIVVTCSVAARLPLLVIGLSALAGTRSFLLNILPVFLFLHYFFGSISGLSWNTWMKDLVPESRLGSFFAKRSSYTQALNAALSITLALGVDYIGRNAPSMLPETYGLMFLIGGLLGLTGVYILARTDEPVTIIEKVNVLKLLVRPLRDGNFFRLLVFNSFWTFALNLATPFFIVFMLKAIQLSISTIIALTIVSQVSSVLTVRAWGAYADKYSNKTIIALSSPLYIMCLIAWCYVGLYQHATFNLIFLLVIHIITGAATAGVNLSITNLGLKLAPKESAVAYLSSRNLIVALSGTAAPVLGGYLADYFSKRSLEVVAQWTRPGSTQIMHLISLHEWNFLFLTAALLGIIALQLLVYVREVGEVEKELVKKIMRKSVTTSLKDFFVIGALLSWREHLWQIIKRRLMSEDK